MFLRLFILFVLVAMAELALLVWIGRLTNVATTLVIILVTGVIGAALVRWQGMRAWRAIRDDLQSGQTPAVSVVDGIVFLVAAVMLLSPGLITDVCGVLLLLPPVRVAVRVVLIAWLMRHVQARYEAFTRTDPDEANSTDGEVIDGEVIDVEFRRADAAHIETQPQSTNDR